MMEIFLERKVSKDMNYEETINRMKELYKQIENDYTLEDAISGLWEEIEDIDKRLKQRINEGDYFWWAEYQLFIKQQKLIRLARWLEEVQSGTERQHRPNFWAGMLSIENEMEK